MNIYEKAVNTFGEETQGKKTIEELGELVTAIIQYSDGRITERDLASEIADVEIMCIQWRHMIDPEVISEEKNQKLRRLGRLIAEAEANGQ